MTPRAAFALPTTTAAGTLSPAAAQPVAALQEQLAEALTGNGRALAALTGASSVAGGMLSSPCSRYTTCIPRRWSRLVTPPASNITRPSRR